MNKTNRRNLFQQGNDIFSWLQGFKLEIPKDRPTTLKDQLGKLRGILTLLEEYVVTENGRRSLKHCREEVDNSEQFKQCGRSDDAMRSWKAARRLFEAAQEDKDSAARFIVGPGGEMQDLQSNP